MDNKLVKNYIYSVLYQMLLVITPFITTPYLTRVMGLEVLSINTWTANLAQWFVLFGIMGVNIYGNREIARVRDNQADLTKTFWEIFTMQFISMIISSLVYVGFLFLNNSDYFLYLALQGITLFSVALDITWFFYGVEDFKKASLRNMFVKLFGIALIFIFVKGPNDLVKFILINTLSGVLGQIIMWVQLRHYIGFCRVNLAGVMRHFKPNIGLFIPQIAISVYSVLDITMLGYLGPRLEEVNLYEQAQKFVKMFLFFITSIGSVMLPRVTNVFHKGNYEQVNAYLTKTLKFALYMSIPMICGIVGMIQNFIDWFLPVSYAPVGNMIIATSPIILFISLSNVFGTQFMVPTGDTKHYTISVVCAAILNFMINFTLIPYLGAYGAIIGSVAAEASVTIIQWFFVKDKIKITIGIKELLKIIISSLLIIVPVRYTGVWLGANILSNLAQVVVGIVVYVAFLLMLKADFLVEMYHSFKQRGLKNG
ncbi:MAG: oligosaccharide flippase family protein [Erysipelotrichaceae bacterium]|nr:oligosaccharide flippase family protein [Erysipelotrichaceae bacterium]MDY5251131.1 oligosaccharide flippase family protein [Erysipelotrichaceae bacterium]